MKFVKLPLKSTVVPICSCDDVEKQKMCVGFLPSVEPLDLYCLFNYDCNGTITDFCFCPGILIKDDENNQRN